MKEKKLKVRIIKSKHHFDIEYVVWLGGTQVAYCDTLTRADVVDRALKAWQETEDYQKWLKPEKKPKKLEKY